MKSIINDYMKGNLIGNLIEMNCDDKLIIKRLSPIESFKNRFSNNSLLLHSTEGYLKNIKIGNADTYLRGNITKWESHKNIRMNIILDKFGYRISDYKIDESRNEIKRTITSDTEFGRLIIIEQIFIKELFLAITNNELCKLN